MRSRDEDIEASAKWLLMVNQRLPPSTFKSLAVSQERRNFPRVANPLMLSVLSQMLPAYHFRQSRHSSSPVSALQAARNGRCPELLCYRQGGVDDPRMSGRVFRRLISLTGLHRKRIPKTWSIRQPKCLANATMSSSVSLQSM